MNAATLIGIGLLFALQVWHMLRMQRALRAKVASTEYTLDIKADTTQAQVALEQLERQFARLAKERERCEGVLR